MRKLILKNTAPFQGLCELVADQEGLFEKEGLVVEWVDREAGVDRNTHTDITNPKEADADFGYRSITELAQPLGVVSKISGPEV